jgi:hypothetical protein
VTLLWGPTVLTRTDGEPNELSETFEVTAEGSVCVKVKTDGGVAAAWLTIDGVEVIGPDALNPNVPLVTARPDLGVGEHTLELRLASRPGSSLTVEIRFAPDGVAPADQIVGDEGLVALSNVFDDPDPFSPAGTDGLPTTTTFGVTGTALKTPGAPSGKYEFLLRAYFDIVSRTT